ncbi:hypothetical protein PGLA_20155 [Paenibacillus glacialis]|uniref:Uncharacterized protein n=1 Tax=Paenibacillus glacialis TaxID=494026 RepID=A0A168HPW1_9BACL|nr:hypothetical protein PGLA_20155 [Paenibacillus glacialis]
MIQKKARKTDRTTVDLRRGDEALVRCRRRHDDDFGNDGKPVKPKIDRIINLRPGENVLVRCRRRHRDDDHFGDDRKRRTTSNTRPVKK